MVQNINNTVDFSLHDSLCIAMYFILKGRRYVYKIVDKLKQEGGCVKRGSERILE